jgi:protein ImuB
LGPDAVQVGRLDGGRGPEDRGWLVPWGSRDGRRHREATAAPWPGRVPPPSPVTVVTAAVAVELADPSGRPLRVDGRGLLTAEPSVLSVGGGPFHPVTAWAGPWPATERWWSARRRRARLQVVATTGAYLLAVEGQRWWLEAVYD